MAAGKSEVAQKGFDHLLGVREKSEVDPGF